MNDSRDSAYFISSKQSLLKISANIVRKSDDAVPKERDFRVFLQVSASTPYGPDLPFVGITAFKMSGSSISSFSINTSWGGSLAFGYFCCNIFKVLSFKGKIPVDMFSVKSLSGPLTLPFLIIFLNCKEIFEVE